MAEGSLGRASLKTGVDSAGLKSGLSSLSGEVKKWADKQQQAFGGQVSAAFRGGLIGGVLGGSLQAGIQAGLEGLGQWALGLDKIAKDSERAADQMSKLNAQGAKVLDRRLAAGDEELALLKGDPAAAIGRIGTQIDALKKELAGAASGAKNAQSELDRMGKFDSAKNFALWVLPFVSLEETLKGPRAEMDALTASADKLRDKIGELERARAKLRAGGPDTALAGDLKALAKSIEFQDRTRDMSPVEQQIEALRERESAHLRAGGKSVMKEFEDVAEAMRRSDFNLRSAAADKAAEDLRQQLSDAKEFAGRTAEEIAVLKMERETKEAHEKGLPGVPADKLQALRDLLPGRAPPWLSTMLQVASQVADQVAPLVAAASKVSTDNAALSFGSSAEVSARIRNDASNVAKEQLAEERRQTAAIQDVAAAVEALPAQINLSLLPM